MKAPLPQRYLYCIVHHFERMIRETQIKEKETELSGNEIARIAMASATKIFEYQHEVALDVGQYVKVEHRGESSFGVIMMRSSRRNHPAFLPTFFVCLGNEPDFVLVDAKQILFLSVCSKEELLTHPRKEVRELVLKRKRPSKYAYTNEDAPKGYKWETSE